jgi:subtilase family serine protease
VFIAALGASGGGVLAVLTVRSAAATPAAHRIGSASRLPDGARVTGRLRSGRSLSLVVALKPSDPSALAAYASAVSTPGSADYRHYLSVAQFRQRFAPSDAQIQAVRSDLRSAGLSPSQVSANGLTINVTAGAGEVSKAFDTTLQQVHLASGRTAYANTTAPQLSGSVAGLVQGVIGLDDLVKPHNQLELGHAATKSTTDVPGAAAPRVAAKTASAPEPCGDATDTASSDGSYTANQIAAAYGFSSLYADSDFGAGQTVALVELSQYESGDIQTFQTCYRTNAAVNDIDATDEGLPDSATVDSTGSGEVVLDVEQIIGLAPAATVDVYEAQGTTQGLFDDYAAIVSADTAKVISTSWGICEAGAADEVDEVDYGGQDETLAAAEDTLFEEAAVQGQSIYAAAGDDGSTDCYDGGKKDRTLAVDDPGSQPYVTGVGGTSLPSATEVSKQSVWNDSTPQGAGGGAGGGGVSALWPMPTYQSGAATSLDVIGADSSKTSCGSTSYCREDPDVSADADPKTGYDVYWSGAAAGYVDGWQPIGGTSAAAPLWAALTALANASSDCAGTSIGFANPVLYDVADNDYYGSAFTDITVGSNDYTNSGYAGELYAAASGYDMATGLGTPLAGTLVPDMCALVHPATASAPASTSLRPICKAATNTLRKGGDNLVLRNHRRSAKLTLSATVASNCSSDKLSFQIHIATSESKHTRANDTLKVRILSTTGKTLATLKTLSNHGAARGYKTVTLRVQKWVGKQVKVRFLASEGGHKSTSFTVREVKLAAS